RTPGVWSGASGSRAPRPGRRSADESRIDSRKSWPAHDGWLLQRPGRLGNVKAWRAQNAGRLTGRAVQRFDDEGFHPGLGQIDQLRRLDPPPAAVRILKPGGVRGRIDLGQAQQGRTGDKGAA